MSYLADVNFWLALTFESHFHHATAIEWFEGNSEVDFHFCRLTQQGYLRLATNPKAFGDEAVTLSEAWVLYDALMADPRVEFAVEPLNLEELWRANTQRHSFSPKVWNDAYLAAFANAASIELITFGSGFRQYDKLALTILS